MRITSKGQVTIPADIRERAGLLPHTEVEFEYAEASVRFTRIEELDAALPSDLFERQPIPYEAAFLAGKAYLAYRRRGGTGRSPLPDFFIGAHAAVSSYRLLTRLGPLPRLLPETVADRSRLIQHPG